MENLEKRGKQKRNLMTAHTKTILEENLRQTTLRLNESQLAIGEAAGRESDWHDNAAFDYANMECDLNSAKLANLERKLQNPEIILPRQEVNEVSVGNTVVVRFQDKSDEETFTILGPDDGGKKPGWLSYLSPLAISLIGKKEGETAEFSVGEREKYKVSIVKILSGNF